VEPADPTPALAIMILDEEANVTLWPPSAERLFGFSASEALGRNLSTLGEPDDAAASVSAVREGLEHGAPRPWRFQRKDGALFAASLLVAAAGERAVAAVVATDGELIDAARERLGTELALSRERMDLVELAREVIGQLVLAHPDRAVAIEGDVTIVGQWDPRRLRRIVQHLGANAFLHGEPDAAVRISWRAIDAGALLTVENHGPEPAPGELARLFEPFRRYGRTGRAGVGLYVARELARAHGGDVTSWWKDGVVTFTLFLPLAAPIPDGARLRRHERVPLDGALQISAGDRAFLADGRDVSARGLSFYSEAKLAVSEHVRIRVSSEGGSFSLIGTVRHVVRERGRSRIGVEFLFDLSPSDVARLRRQH
jgi:PAS domain S-box-containing protein